MASFSRFETRRVRRHLQACVLDADLEQRDIEARAGLSPGYLSQVLRGRIELKLQHVFAVLEAIDHPPARFFASLYGGEGGRAVALPDDRDLASVFGLGIASLESLRGRLERCEDVLTDFRDAVRTDGGDEADGDG